MAHVARYAISASNSGSTQIPLRRFEWVGRFAGRNLLDRFDDAAAELCIGDPSKCVDQRETLGCRQKIGRARSRFIVSLAVGEGFTSIAPDRPLPASIGKPSF